MAVQGVQQQGVPQKLPSSRPLSWIRVQQLLHQQGNLRVLLSQCGRQGPGLAGLGEGHGAFHACMWHA